MPEFMSVIPVTIKEMQRDSTWDFATADTKEFTHCFHSYPAMMIPQVARKMLKIYGKQDSSLIDPFMGSGSVLVEGMLHEPITSAYGLDINPLAILIAKTKTTPIKPQLLENTFSKILSEFDKKKNTDLGFYNLTNIKYWFKEQAINDLSRLKSSIDEVDNGKIKNFFLVCFSETTRKVSNTRPGEFKLYRINEKKLANYLPNTLEVFTHVVKRNIKGMHSFYSAFNYLDKKTAINIYKEDSRTKTSIPSESCDILVTSPPYGDSRTTVAYGQYSRLSSQLLGYSYDEIRRVDQNGLGGKRSYKENNLDSPHLQSALDKISAADEIRALDVLAFYEDFNKCITEIDRIMKPNSHLCFVVGNRTVKGVKILTNAIIAELFESRENYSHLKTIIRKIPNKKMPKINSPTNVKGVTGQTMDEEYLLILKKLNC
ncbi:DNA adenine methylase [Candidatus Woesearchaeota archaeon]|nr:DNA adenine methylase [Candidatus Woesearchaeota archaeon]